LRGAKQIVVLGDYDVDGVSSTALLVRCCGASGSIRVCRAAPLRGWLRPVAQRDRSRAGGGKPDLFIALDCGTNSHDEVAYLRGQGIDVMVIDHHRSKERRSRARILINPHVHTTCERTDGVAAISARSDWSSSSRTVC
jgi:single-stranded-DNA-specific exonuclease